MLNKEKLNRMINIINKKLESYLLFENAPQQKIFEAMRYSLLAGGKRIRPVLALAVCEMLGGDEEEVIPFACAVEMIHTYSLIHDDLPAMDNDDYRRGRLTSHKVYGEAMAILAGDALLNYAFEIMLQKASENSYNTENKVKGMQLISKAAGISGMIGGQVVDIASEGKVISKELLEYMHRCKTGALIKAPIMAAAAICGAAMNEISALEKYAENLGLAFQIKDDILDVEGDFEKLGKNVGSDAENKKSTFVSIYGLEESKKMLESISQEAVEALKVFGEKAEFLKEFVLYLIKRSN